MRPRRQKYSYFIGWLNRSTTRLVWVFATGDRGAELVRARAGAATFGVRIVSGSVLHNFWCSVVHYMGGDQLGSERGQGWRPA